MDEQTYMTKMAAAFLDELSEIEKKAFLGKIVGTLGRGLHGLGRAAGVGAGGQALKGGLARRVFGSAAGKRGFGEHIAHLYRGGAAGGKGVWGGIKSVAQSPVGAMAAVPAAVGGTYLAGRTLFGGGRQQGY